MPYSDTVRKLKKNVGVARYLQELEAAGKLRRPRSRTGEAARLAGYTQDVVQAPDGELISQYAALCRYGDQWYKSTKPTDWEMLTSRGLEALQEWNNSG